MRVFLDDERTTPEGWVRTYWPDETIALLKAGGVEEVSLDHDLGDDQRGTGYDVILWIEEAIVLNGFFRPKSPSTPLILPHEREWKLVFAQ